MDIGTAKPSKEQLHEVKHYFIDTKDISELYGAGHFEKDAITLLNELFKEKDIVFIVGGSGLYIDALLNGVDDFADVPTGVRDKLNKQFEENGIEWLQNELKTSDPEYYESVDINNPQRIIRALEVFVHTGKKFSSFLKNKTVERNFIPVKLFINTNREKLYSQINSRVDDMMAQGLLEEVKSLEKFKDLNALKTVGYKELFEHLEGKMTLKEAVDKVKQHTRNYAKRQVTWFKNRGEWEEFEPGDIEKIKAYIDIIMNHG
ncbi:MAG: miaA [Bacteroidetes bacterium]|jgi:tRNA dimethylallyltransferase|nr:miaA [Bacteroidota bacterium]